MKTIKQISVIAIAIITLGIIAGITACNNDNPAGEQPKVQPDTPRNLSFGTEENPCTVTIKSDDQFTTAEWTTLCDKVVGAIEDRYKTASQASFEEVFASNWGAIVVLGSNFTYNWEVKDGDFKKAYIKTDSIDTVNFNMIILRMKNSIAGKDPA
jgi:hypothetical protein